MSEPLEEYRQQASYRRGTVMGLTAAEAFMLIAFVLLTLLVFWQVSANEEKEELLEENARLAAAIEGAEDPVALANALALQKRFAGLDLDTMEERLSLMEDEKLRALASEAIGLPQEGLLELTDLTREGAFPGVKQKLAVLEEVGLQPGAITELQNELASAREGQLRLEEELSRLATIRAKLEEEKEVLGEQVAAFTEMGLSPSEIRSMEATLEELGERQRSLARTGAEIAATIRANAGDRIAALGGKILPDGDVIFPDAILFDAGDDAIKPQFDTLLQSFCRLWFETLYEQRDALDTVQVEGHASSEYANYGPEEAFVRNLDLSQRRAAAVFSRCLAIGGDDEVTDWARSSMAAVGYSSSRAIIENGVENRAASRRVVFALEPKTESQMMQSVLAASAASLENAVPFPAPRETLGQELGSNGPADPFSPMGPEYFRGRGYTALSGRVTHVRDGDTIEIGAQAIRIEGLHAPELDTEVGQRAKRYVSELVAGKFITCWLNGEETHDRKVGVCFHAQQDIAARIVAEGLGLDCPAFSGGRYERFERKTASNITDLPGYCRKG